MAKKASQSLQMDYFRRRLANVEALPQLVILAAITGLVTGLVILGFRQAIESILALGLGGGDSEAFETLDPLTRLLLPIAGGLAIGLAFNHLSPAGRRVGVVHVMERLSRHQGFLPMRNAIVQFLGGVLALCSGQSGGREGPAIHLGAASASFLGRSFELPNNSIRTLVACGTAAAIAGSFNTPIAGVIFAMEVVMMEYTIASFIPVIVAAVISTLLTVYFYGSEPAFSVAPAQMESLLEIPYIILGGILVGIVAAGFIYSTQLFAKLSHWPYWLRGLFAGTLTGLCALITPEVMGIGYDTVNAAMLGLVPLNTLLLLLLLKTLASTATVGLGLPVGLIGPTLVVGACFGGIMEFGSNFYDPIEAPNQGLYVVLGMCAMMAAVLQAPLAALMAILELTANPNIILPAMLMIVVASLITSELFGHKGVFVATLKTLGLQYPPNPVTAYLNRAGVTSIMERDFARLPEAITPEQAQNALTGVPRWILIETAPGEIRSALKASDLQAFLEENPELTAASELSDTAGPDRSPPIRLLELPGMRKDVADIDFRATLQEAQEKLRRSNAEALCVRRMSAPLISPILGVLTQEDINNYRDVSKT